MPIVLNYTQYDDENKTCRDFVKYFETETEYMNWMDSTDYMRQASYKDRSMRITSIIEVVKRYDIDPAIANAQSATRVDAKARAEKKAELIREREEL